jgi:hypothetical protein
MAIHYTMTAEGDLLLVEAAGFDESLEEVQQYGMAIVNACRTGNYTRVLCNEFNLEYRLGTLDTFKSAEYLAAQAPKLGKTAIVCNGKFIVDAKFWETVAVNRGLTVRFFKDTNTARQWLSES